MESRGTILVVDHDKAARAAAVSVAMRLGYASRAVANADPVFDELETAPALAIVEVELPGPTSGLELMQELHRRHGSDLPVILVSAERIEPLDRVAGLLLGADDYIAKPFDRGELLARVRRSLSRSGAAAGNGIENGHHSANGTTDRDIVLSPRELEILGMLSQGLGQPEIAQKLVLSPKTVGTHIQHILSKLNVHSRAQAVAEAYRRGLVSPDFTGHELAAAPV